MLEQFKPLETLQAFKALGALKYLVETRIGNDADQQRFLQRINELENILSVKGIDTNVDNLEEGSK